MFFQRNYNIYQSNIVLYSSLFSGKKIIFRKGNLHKEFVGKKIIYIYILGKMLYAYLMVDKGIIFEALDNTYDKLLTKVTNIRNQ